MSLKLSLCDICDILSARISCNDAKEDVHDSIDGLGTGVGDRAKVHGYSFNDEERTLALKSAHYIANEVFAGNLATSESDEGLYAFDSMELASASDNTLAAMVAWSCLEAAIVGIAGFKEGIEKNLLDGFASSVPEVFDVR